MHKINVLCFGSDNFNTSLEELKEFLNFQLTFSSQKIEREIKKNYEVLLIHENYLKDKLISNETLNKLNQVKVLVSTGSNNKSKIFDEILNLPTNINDLNDIIEKSIVKKNFNLNSSIQIKNYTLDKNEKKLMRSKDFILLTEKEIQLLELLLKEKKSISKNEILNRVWKYVEGADTHTVETHIYRLRKKIKSKFYDDNFILNDKSGYLL
tara:strand:- start:595 stop:1224 length:630 start_codon:yes stop_codon:yes gene_type:complete